MDVQQEYYSSIVQPIIFDKPQASSWNLWFFKYQRNRFFFFKDLLSYLSFDGDMVKCGIFRSSIVCMQCVNTLRGGRTCGNGLLPSFVSPSVRTSSTLGTSGLSPVSFQPKKSWPASSKALSVLVPPRMWGNAFMAFFREFAVCASVNLKANILRFFVWQDVSTSQMNQTGRVKKWGTLARIFEISFSYVITWNTQQGLNQSFKSLLSD